MKDKTKSNQQKWRSHLEAWHSSGLTQQAYCQMHGLKPHQFWYWKKKLGDSSVKIPVKKSTQTAFVPVKIEKIQQASNLSVTLLNGVTLNGIEEHNLQLVRQLIGVLK